MWRQIYSKLIEWKEKPGRKPLLLYGARQVGKTYILKEFGNNEFSNMLYVNCESNPRISNLFSTDFNIKRIIEGLEIIYHTSITPQKTLIFFDEVQEIPAIINALKYFNEETPDICIAAAGSLLGIHDLNGYSFPVGKVDILHIYPMTFREFLRAMHEEKKADLLDQKDYNLINALLPSYIELLRKYYFIGGMPEAVRKYVENGDLDEVRRIQKTILDGYYADIAKHAAKDAIKCRMVMDSIPSQLAKENKKFIYGAVKKGGRAKEFENAIQWLVDAGLIYRIKRISKPALPLKFYFDIDAFKLYLLDVGLLGAMLNVMPAEVLLDNNIFTEYKGAFTENYVLEQLIIIPDIEIGYYSKNDSTVEVDIVIQHQDKIYPIEIKAENNVRSRSLHRFVHEEFPSEKLHGNRLSMLGYKMQEWMTNYPLIIPDFF